MYKTHSFHAARVWSRLLHPVALRNILGLGTHTHHARRGLHLLDAVATLASSSSLLAPCVVLNTGFHALCVCVLLLPFSFPSSSALLSGSLLARWREEEKATTLKPRGRGAFTYTGLGAPVYRRRDDVKRPATESLFLFSSVSLCMLLLLGQTTKISRKRPKWSMVGPSRVQEWC